MVPGDEEAEMVSTVATVTHLRGHPRPSRRGFPVTTSETTSAAAVTPLVELVALAAQNGWEITATADGDLEWSRAGNRIVAKFSKSTQRPRRCALVNYTDYEQTGTPQVGAVVWRGVGNGGDAEEAYASLRHWFGQRPRTLADPTQW